MSCAVSQDLAARAVGGEGVRGEVGVRGRGTGKGGMEWVGLWRGMGVGANQNLAKHDIMDIKLNRSVIDSHWPPGEGGGGGGEGPFSGVGGKKPHFNRETFAFLILHQSTWTQGWVRAGDGKSTLLTSGQKHRFRFPLSL